MIPFLPFLLFTVGLIMIIKGSDWFVDSSIWIAHVLKVPDIIIGATLVSLCTTLPETVVSTSSALRGNAGIAVGNALGSIAFNTGIILALTIIISRPALEDKEKLLKKGILLIALLIFVAIIGLLFGEINRWTGIALLGCLAWYLYDNVQESIHDNCIMETYTVDLSRNAIIKKLTLFVIGLALTISGANLLVANGEQIARLIGVPDIVIGLTITAVGTSLPELMTAMTAIRKKAHNISIGNILGANILNIILVIAVSSIILPIPVDSEMLRFHLPFTLLIVTSMVAFAFMNKSNFKRRNGFLLLCTYLVYISFVTDIF